MPFSRNYKNKNNKNDCVSLQVQWSVNEKVFIENKECKQNLLWKRAFLLASKKTEGGITIEAAIVTAIFMYAILGIMYFMMLLNFHMGMQITINNSARVTAKKMYYMDMLEKVQGNTKISNIKDNIKYKLAKNQEYDDVDKEIESADKIDEGIFKTYLYAELMKEVGAKNVAKHLVNLAQSRLDADKGMIDIIVSYKYHFPYINNGIELVQRAKVKAWNGYDIKYDSQKVYVTLSGKVYHKDKTCTYLDLKIEKVSPENLKSIRNASGNVYSECKNCIKGNLGKKDFVYITLYGERYHSTLECSGLTRNVIIMDINDIGERTPCSKCGV